MRHVTQPEGSHVQPDPIAQEIATDEPRVGEASLLAQAAAIEAEGFTIEEGHYLRCIVTCGDIGSAETHPEVFAKLVRRGLAIGNKLVGYKTTPVGLVVNERLKNGDLLPVEHRAYRTSAMS